MWRNYRERGPAGLVPGYARCGRPKTIYPQVVRDSALRLWQERSSGGAPYVRLKLLAIFPESGVPTLRTLQRWFRAAQYDWNATEQ
jgi:hypothetical protein